MEPIAQQAAAAAERGETGAALALAALAVLVVAAREGAALLRWLLARYPAHPGETPSAKQRALDGAVAQALAKRGLPASAPTPQPVDDVVRALAARVARLEQDKRQEGRSIEDLRDAVAEVLDRLRKGAPRGERSK